MYSALYKRSLVILFCVLVAVPVLAQKKRYDPEKTFTAKALKEDLDFMKSALEEGHPTLYWYTSTAAMEVAFQQAYEQIREGMTEREYLQLLTPLIENIHCAHTTIRPSKDYAKSLEKEGRYLPLEVRIEESYNVYVRHYHGGDSLLKKGDQLLSINQIPANELSRRFVAYSTVDGYANKAKFVFAEKRFASFVNLYVGEPDTFKVQLLRGGSDTLQLSFSSVTRKALVKSGKDRLKQVKEKEARQQGEEHIRKSLKGEKIIAKGKNEFRLIENDSIKAGYLVIRSFSSPGFNKLYKTSFRTLQEKQIEHLIIDLRDNGGGSSSAAIELMQYLSADEFPYYRMVAMKKKDYSFKRQLDMKPAVFVFSKFKAKAKNAAGLHDVSIFGTGSVKPKKLHFNKNVYVLTNGLSASASALFSANMKFQNKAVLIGEETGGGYEGCAAMISPNLTLPATKVRLRFPLMKVLAAVGGQETGRGVLPHHEVPLDFESFISGRDNQLRYALKLILDQQVPGKGQSSSVK